MSRGTIAVCGEALVDLVQQDGGLFRALPGGSPANVAVGLARLDVPVRMLARLATGTFGALSRRHLADNGVDLSLSVAATEPATLAVVATNGRGEPSYEFWIDGTADWQWRRAELPDPLPADLVAVHAGSLALAVEPGASLITEWLSRTRARSQVTISLDPNIRPTLDGDPAVARSRVERQVSLADVVKVSVEDLAWLAPGEDPVALARRWQRQDRGPALAVVTLGQAGAVGVTAEGREVRRPAPPVSVVDTVGAGDAFTAGLLAALARADLLGASRRGRLAALGTDSLAALLDEAALVAALTCTRAGADPPTLAAVREARPDQPGAVLARRPSEFE